MSAIAGPYAPLVFQISVALLAVFFGARPATQRLARVLDVGLRDRARLRTFTVVPALTLIGWASAHLYLLMLTRPW